MEHERIRRAFSSTPELRVRTLCDTPGIAVQSVLRLVLDGRLHIDWWEPLGRESRVSITPIGRQVWPSPRQGSHQHIPCAVILSLPVKTERASSPVEARAEGASRARIR